jgi:hypothetical protein
MMKSAQRAKAENQKYFRVFSSKTERAACPSSFSRSALRDMG